ncbi:DUF3800 domain-containing protein [Amedibacillus dolichus]|uniref:DUF3800 domain-containing protein n=1 Tax=Amedibacillus dolichus DSM 3991 TaxID=428127 RepID=A8RD26_9FIRM|nr:DUF3800 domain-containing protein [Amedibacillus dolichus]EDP10971.1 hypothetical protein EUBDOL_01570 [Amedibacillus dolichus DSM 3991]
MWRDRPTVIEEWIEGATHVAFFDENGDADMSYITKCKLKGKKIDEFSKYFGLTSVLLEQNNFIDIMFSINAFKEKYWPDNGCYDFNGKYQKVCLHSREIRKQTGPFSKNIIGATNFMEDLNSLMGSLPMSITSSFIDKERLEQRYGSYAQSPYNISVTFILERLAERQLKDTDKVIIILESRGRKEDAIILDTIVRLIKYGTRYVSEKQFKKIIGVYFNPKRCQSDCKKSYFGLEIADLCAYPIFKYCRNHKEDKAFEIIKSKIYGYPEHLNYGIKRFP